MCQFLGHRVLTLQMFDWFDLRWPLWQPSSVLSMMWVIYVEFYWKINFLYCYCWPFTPQLSSAVLCCVFYSCVAASSSRFLAAGSNGAVGRGGHETGDYWRCLPHHPPPPAAAAAAAAAAADALAVPRLRCLRRRGSLGVRESECNNSKNVREKNSREVFDFENVRKSRKEVPCVYCFRDHSIRSAFNVIKVLRLYYFQKKNKQFFKFRFDLSLFIHWVWSQLDMGPFFCWPNPIQSINIGY